MISRRTSERGRRDAYLPLLSSSHDGRGGARSGATRRLAALICLGVFTVAVVVSPVLLQLAYRTSSDNEAKPEAPRTPVKTVPTVALTAAPAPAAAAAAPQVVAAQEPVAAAPQAPATALEEVDPSELAATPSKDAPFVQEYAVQDPVNWVPLKVGAAGKDEYEHAVVAGTHYMNQPQKLEAILTSNHMLTVAEDRVAWLKINKRGEYEDVLVSSGEGIYLSAVQGELLDNTWTTLWLLVRTTPSNGAKLLRVVSVGPYTGTVLEEVDLPLTSPISMMRYENYIFVASESGNVLHIHYPDMAIKGAYFVSSEGAKVSAIHPLSDNMFWFIMNNGDKSEVVSVVIWDGKISIVGRRNLPGTNLQNLVKWNHVYVSLDAESGSLLLLDGLDDASNADAVRGKVFGHNIAKGRYLKGLSVVNNIAFIGATGAGGAPTEMIFIDLVNGKVLGSAPIRTNGQVNAVSATHMNLKSCYESIAMNSDLFIPLALKGGENKPYQMMFDTHVNVEPILRMLEQIKADVGDEYGPYTEWMMEGQQTNAFNGGTWYSNNDKLKPGVLAIVGIFSSDHGELVFKFPWWEKYFKPALQTILDEIFEPILGKGVVHSRILRAQFAIIQPETSSIHQHWDCPCYATVGHRVHIPVTWNEGVRFDIGAKNLTVQVGLGDVFEVDNAVSHGVVNTGTTDRIHLVIDIRDEAVDNYFMLEQGKICGMKNTCNSPAQ